MRNIILIAVLILSGCSTTNYRILTPYEVSTIPIDCFNKARISNWIEIQIQAANRNSKEYQENLNALKYKLWEVRSRCNT